MGWVLAGTKAFDQRVGPVDQSPCRFDVGLAFEIERDRTTAAELGGRHADIPRGFAVDADDVGAHVGDVMIGLGHGALQVVGFLGQVILSAATLLRHPGRFRMKALVHQMELVGVNALAIIVERLR